MNKYGADNAVDKKVDSSANFERSWKTENGKSYRIKCSWTNLMGSTSAKLYYEIFEIGAAKDKVSTSSELQSTISTWYKGLRLVALVGLLSVLVYVGIRIIISSTGQEKAKYKKMIGDWLIAICILFVLHYIMAFTMTITEKITDVFKVTTLGENQEDTLMSNIRNDIHKSQYSNLTTFTNLILYIVLVIYTCILCNNRLFSIALKRV